MKDGWNVIQSIVGFQVGSSGFSAMSRVAPANLIFAPAHGDRAGACDLSRNYESILKLEACGIAVAALSFGRRPLVGKGVGFVFTDGRLRITTRKPSNDKLIEAVLRGSPIAATFSRPTTHGSLQFKARSARLDEPDKDDYLAAERQRERFFSELIECAYPPGFTERYTAFAPHELIVVEFDPDETFDQTPGPAAGARLR